MDIEEKIEPAEAYPEHPHDYTTMHWHINNGNSWKQCFICGWVDVNDIISDYQQSLLEKIEKLRYPGIRAVGSTPYEVNKALDQVEELFAPKEKK
jgi:hypothetical protein